MPTAAWLAAVVVLAAYAGAMGWRLGATKHEGELDILRGALARADAQVDAARAAALDGHTWAPDVSPTGGPQFVCVACEATECAMRRALGMPVTLAAEAGVMHGEVAW